MLHGNGKVFVNKIESIAKIMRQNYKQAENMFLKSQGWANSERNEGMFFYKTFCTLIDFITNHQDTFIAQV